MKFSLGSVLDFLTGSNGNNEVPGISAEDKKIVQISEQAYKHLEDIEKPIEETLAMIEVLLQSPKDNDEYLRLLELQMKLSQVKAPLHIAKAIQHQRALTHQITDLGIRHSTTHPNWNT